MPRRERWASRAPPLFDVILPLVGLRSKDFAKHDFRGWAIIRSTDANAHE